LVVCNPPLAVIYKPTKVLAVTYLVAKKGSDALSISNVGQVWRGLTGLFRRPFRCSPCLSNGYFGRWHILRGPVRNLQEQRFRFIGLVPGNKITDIAPFG